MTEILTELIGNPNYPLTPHETHQVYNGLDTAITLEVFKEIAPLLTPQSLLTYNFSRAMQAPALEMMLRGIKIDQFHRWNTIRELELQAEKVQEILDEFATAIWGRGLGGGAWYLQ